MDPPGIVLPVVEEIGLKVGGFVPEEDILLCSASSKAEAISMDLYPQICGNERHLQYPHLNHGIIHHPSSI